MSIFSKILSKLGIKKDEKEEEAAPVQTPAAVAKKGVESSAKPQPAAAKPASAPAPKTVAPPPPQIPHAAPQATVAAAPKPISEVDVVSKLETLSKGKGLNWKVSIADLLALLEIDNSRDARIELAKELGCPSEYISGDLSKMNVWLHKAVLKKIAENGGNIPRELMD